MSTLTGSARVEGSANDPVRGTAPTETFRHESMGWIASSTAVVLASILVVLGEASLSYGGNFGQGTVPRSAGTAEDRVLAGRRLDARGVRRLRRHAGTHSRRGRTFVPLQASAPQTVR
jgi:hypothetical protein